MSNITVFVQAPEALRRDWQTTADSIEASDIGKDYTVCLQREDQSCREHFMEMLSRMAECTTEMVLRLEDDVLVNRHILFNIDTWSERHQPQFGAGWAFDPGGTTLSTHDRMYRRPPSKSRWVSGSLMAYSQATLFYVRDLVRIRQLCWTWFSTRGGLKVGCEQDLAIAWAVNQMKRQICVHAPSLVEHRMDVKSLLDHKHVFEHGTSKGTFSVDWKRDVRKVG